MVADDALLMAYVDGELSSQQNQELERLHRTWLNESPG